jgi:Arc/MetJ-type ribon-helix-helix transcriptional regulator
MIVRIDQNLKDKISRLAQSEGKNLSELVRELLEKYTKERDMSTYIDELWGSISKNLSKNNISESDVENAIKNVRSNKNAQYFTGGGRYKYFHIFLFRWHPQKDN